MICYQDKTFCISPNCVCDRKLTDEIREAARQWWGNDNAPISMAELCKEDE